MKSRSSPLLVGGLLLAMVIVLFALAVLARPSVPAVEPVTSQPAAAAASPTLTPAPATPTLQPTAMPTGVATPVVATSTTEPTSRTVVVAPADPPQPLDVQVAAAPSPTPFGWWDFTNQFDASLDAEVRAAYTHYWQQRVDAAFNLDPSLLPQVEANPWLAAETSVLNNLVAANTARKVEAHHTFRVRYASDTEALVLDDYTLHVQSVDPNTRETLSDDGSTSYHTVTRMQKLDGTWKAVDEVQVTRS